MAFPVDPVHPFDGAAILSGSRQEVPSLMEAGARRSAYARWKEPQHQECLRKLAEGDALRREGWTFSEARTIGGQIVLQCLLAQRVKGFAYPYWGALSAETVDAARAASFEIAVTCEETPLRSNGR